MTMIRKNINLKRSLTPEEISELCALRNRPITFDDDCPELTDEQLSRAVRHKNNNHRREDMVKMCV